MGAAYSLTHSQFLQKSTFGAIFRKNQMFGTGKPMTTLICSTRSVAPPLLVAKAVLAELLGTVKAKVEGKYTLQKKGLIESTIAAEMAEYSDTVDNAVRALCLLIDGVSQMQLRKEAEEIAIECTPKLLKRKEALAAPKGASVADSRLPPHRKEDKGSKVAKKPRVAASPVKVKVGQRRRRSPSKPAAQVAAVQPAGPVKRARMDNARVPAPAPAPAPERAPTRAPTRAPARAPAPAPAPEPQPDAMSTSSDNAVKKSSAVRALHPDLVTIDTATNGEFNPHRVCALYSYSVCALYPMLILYRRGTDHVLWSCCRRSSFDAK